MDAVAAFGSAAFLWNPAWLHWIFARPKQGWTKCMSGFHGALDSFHPVHFPEILLHVTFAEYISFCAWTYNWLPKCKVTKRRWLLIKELSFEDVAVFSPQCFSDQRGSKKVQQWSYCAYLCLRCGLQVTQPIAQPLSSQAELAILLLDAGHALEHHFIILSRQNRLQSVCMQVWTPWACVHRDHKFIHTCSCIS